MVNFLCKNHHIFPNVEWAAVTKQTQQRESGRHQWVYYQFPVIQDSYTIHKSNSLIPNTLLSHTQLDKCVCVLICVSMCIYVYVYLHIHIYTHTYNFISFYFPLHHTLYHVGIISTTARPQQRHTLFIDKRPCVNMPEVPCHCVDTADAASSLSDTSARRLRFDTLLLTCIFYSHK